MGPGKGAPRARQSEANLKAPAPPNQTGVTLRTAREMGGSRRRMAECVVGRGHTEEAAWDSLMLLPKMPLLA